MPVVMFLGWTVLSISAILLWMVIGGFILVGLDQLLFNIKRGDPTRHPTGIEFALAPLSLIWPLMGSLQLLEIATYLFQKITSFIYRKFIYTFFPEKYYEKFVKPYEGRPKYFVSDINTMYPSIILAENVSQNENKLSS